MAVLWHGFIFIFSGALIWFLTGVLINSTERIAKQFKRSLFSVAFLLLGILTSLSEASVAINAAIEKVPQASAGDLVGASFMIFLLIVPVLAIFGGGVELSHAFKRKELLVALTVVAIPSLLAIDGKLTTVEGWVMIIFYALLLYIVETKQDIHATERAVQEKVTFRNGSIDVGKIILGGTIIFLAARMLVNETIYFSNIFSLPLSFIGLLVLAFGTNVPELVIAMRAVSRGYKQVAFGDYVGSAAANTLIFGLLIVLGGPFDVAKGGFRFAFVFTAIGFIMLYIFARSEDKISRREGIMLACVYLGFLVAQFAVVL